MEADKLTELAIRSKAYWGYSQSFMRACRNELAVTEQLLNSAIRHYYVAEGDSGLLGYYAIAKLSEREFELEALFVEPAVIGKGIGKLLMNHAKRLVRQLGGDKITIQSDPNAEGFYRAAGGKIFGSRESQSIPQRQLPLLTIDLMSNDVA
ncbi:GNAT family N-acetyltransferase [Lacimicrobium alkaliphilum]|uniref:GNAT family N-acetyltransferase n=1 Tax=Lacimicrobium alkaliphilum TaxID=1526571 RepID=UPI0018D260A2|nr:GNAT family N-acetyltransferase [Lacimicrobium alkaliphilum]